MVGLHVQCAYVIVMHLHFVMVARLVSLIAIDVSYPWIMNSDSKIMHFVRTHVSGLWKLPYFTKLLLPHNIDVMHNERNIAEAIWNTLFDVPDKTKDNAKARQDLANICNRPSQHLKLKANGKWDRP